MRVAPPIRLSPEQRKELERAARARSLPARELERAHSHGAAYGQGLPHVWFMVPPPVG